MDEKQLEVLQTSHDFLIKNITPWPLNDILYSDSILTNDDVIRLQKEVTPNDQNRMLLVNMLPKATRPATFSSLLTALKKTEQHFIADYLQQQLEKGKNYVYFADKL